MASIGGYASTFSELGGFQGVVVGVLWFGRQRGDVREVSESTVTLQGDPGLCKTQVTLKALMQAVKGREQGVLVEFINMEFSPETKFASIPEAVQGVLQQFRSVFDMPLPPSRGFEHAIVLKEGVAAMSVRPYHYPQIQKAKIE
ncbi:hypothetical protein CK203_029460 [Vitis vinifera]|uniref:Uncharacterized protein n=1 Tax=Vitis vinifera TaxID=29760 RepID=A0A438JCJ1_VITVI|nr:hypothetical protein CK203_029460 [Vitis vinifera]